jgi:hypothetical protein
MSSEFEYDSDDFGPPAPPIHNFFNKKSDHEENEETRNAMAYLLGVRNESRKLPQVFLLNKYTRFECGFDIFSTSFECDFSIFTTRFERVYISSSLVSSVDLRL